MKGFVFAAGLGTRLHPLTLTRPKALVEVGGKTMLERVIMRLADAGAESVIINVHHFSQMVIDFLNARDFGVSVTVSDESDLLLDTGGGLKKARRLVGDELLLVHNADIFSDVNLRDIVAAHVASGADATLLTASRDSSRCLLFDGDGHMKGWHNRSTGETRPASLSTDGLRQLSFGGIHVLSPTTLDRLDSYRPGQKIFSITDFYIDNAATLNIRAWMQPADTEWIDIGKPESLRRAQQLTQ